MDSKADVSVNYARRIQTRVIMCNALKGLKIMWLRIITRDHEAYYYVYLYSSGFFIVCVWMGRAYQTYMKDTTRMRSSEGKIAMIYLKTKVLYDKLLNKMCPKSIDLDVSSETFKTGREETVWKETPCLRVQRR